MVYKLPPFIRFFIGSMISGLAVLYVSPGSAYQIDYNGTRDSQLLACDQMLWRDIKQEALDCYNSLLFTSADKHVQAEAAWAMSDVHRANTLFAEAAVAAPQDPSVKTRWGYLYNETGQVQDAIGLFQEALDINPDYEPAKIGIAAAVTSQFRGDVQNQLYNILEDNPENIRAMLIIAKLALERRDVQGALPYLDAAMDQINENFPPLEIYAMYASADYLSGNSQSPWIERALEYNPGYGDLFVTMAYFAEITYQYRQAVAFLERATEIDADNWQAHSALGINLTRINRIDEAAPHLEAAYGGDPFNIETVNMLRLMDTFDEYLVLRNTIEYEANGETHSVEIQLRLRQDEVAVLETYVLELLQMAIPIYADRYNFIPQEPITIEIYPNHDDFAVRTVGTPGVGLLGVAFGYLFAMDSPTSSASADFHWGNVLWHELAHVFSLEASSSRTTRWFSEGLSVFEEWHSGPVGSIHLPSYVYEAIRDDKLLPVADLDSGFMRPTYENQIMVSYMQAGLTCTYIAERWGDDALADMLLAFRNGLDGREAIETVLDTKVTSFDRDFEKWLSAQFDNLLSNYDQWVNLNKMIGMAIENEDWQQVIHFSQQSLDIYPEDTGTYSAWRAQAMAYRELEDLDGERRALEGYFSKDGYAPEMLNRLAEIYQMLGDTRGAHRVHRALRFIAPQGESLHLNLANEYFAQGEFQQAISEYEILLAMDIHDKSSVYLSLARTYLAMDKRDDARRQVLKALEIAPFYREAQQLLMQLTNQDHS